MSSALQPFFPRFRIDIFDAVQETPELAGPRVAAVLSDGQRGALVLYDERWQTVLQQIFCQTIKAHMGAETAAGISVSHELQLDAYSLPALSYATQYLLPEHCLRAQWMQLDESLMDEDISAC